MLKAEMLKSEKPPECDIKATPKPKATAKPRRTQYRQSEKKWPSALQAAIKGD
jgi:hypothetical protein